MKTILYKNKTFPVRKIEHPELGVVLISINSLNESIMNENGNYISEEAKAIDEQIYFYVEDNEIKLSENALINLLLLEAL